MRKTFLLALIMIFGIVSSGLADKILLTKFDYTGYTTMQSTLVSAGHSVDIVDCKTAGTLAATMDATSYDQVFLFDLTGTKYLNDSDIKMLVAFLRTHPSIVVDTRSYGYHFQGNDPSEQALLINIASAFSERKGGVWVGSDHDPAWTNNSNPFLEAAGFDKITGSYSEAVNDVDPNSILLKNVVTTDLWAAGQSVGMAPLGIQPNGLDMRYHFGHSSPQSGAIPYITASFGNYVAPDEDRDNLVYLAHLTGTPDWRDVLEVDNPDSAAQEFTLELFKSGQLVSTTTYQVPAHAYQAYNIKDIVSDATFGIIKHTNSTKISFRISYEAIQSGGVAQFYAPSNLGQELAFNFANDFAMVTWKGLAIANPGTAAASVQFTAYSNSAALGTATISVPAKSKVAALHSTWFPSISVSQIQRIVATSSGGDLTGITISGNSSSSKMLFTPARIISGGQITPFDSPLSTPFSTDMLPGS